MTLNETFNPASLVRSLGVVAIAGLLAFAIAAPSEAQRRRNNDDEEQVEGRVLTAAVGEQVESPTRASPAVAGPPNAGPG